MADNRLAEEAWFDACFAELDDSSEYDNIIADDMVMDDIDMDDSASAADMGSPSEQPPELSPALSDSGYCDGNASDIEAVTPPSLGQPNDSALVDDTSNDAADWWPVSMPVMTQQQQPTTGKPRVVQPCWKINATSTSTAKSNSTETASPSLWNNWSINNNWT
ncbi:hypothetical protein BDF19DRAFT_410173 [Syncephalis fuscata]|nr:hypothetical protein BDF19DRAFT_410173 [Syncephalis fuscata]